MYTKFKKLGMGSHDYFLLINTIKSVRFPGSLAVVYPALPKPPQIGGTPQTRRNSSVNFSDVIHYPSKNPPGPPPIREVLHKLLLSSQITSTWHAQ